MVPEKFQALKILQLIDSLHSGGAERMCVNISNVLHESGHDVTLCASREGGTLEKFITPGVRYCLLKKKSPVDLAAFRSLIRIIRDNEISVVHAHSSSLFWAVAAKIFLRSLKIIWHDHLGIKIYDRKKIYFYKLISSKIDGIISVNQELVEWSRQNMKVPSERIVMINNFPLLNIVSKQSDPKVFTIVCLANLRPQKDHPTLIRAVAELNEMNLPKSLKVIMAGSADNQEYSDMIRTLIKELKLEDIIEMHGSVEDTASLLASADCGVLTSVSEGLPVALLEYGMAALPVVVTDVGQCAEVVGNGKHGILIKPGDSSSLANSLLKLVNNKDYSDELAKSLERNVKQNYGAERFLKGYEKVLSFIFST